jgi:hypothetical protein
MFYTQKKTTKKKTALLTKMDSATTPTASCSATTPSSTASASAGLPTGAVIGISVGVGLGALIAIGAGILVWAYLRARRRQRRRPVKLAAGEQGAAAAAAAANGSNGGGGGGGAGGGIFGVFKKSSPTPSIPVQPHSAAAAAGGRGDHDANLYGHYRQAPVHEMDAAGTLVEVSAVVLPSELGGRQRSEMPTPESQYYMWYPTGGDDVQSPVESRTKKPLPAAPGEGEGGVSGKPEKPPAPV